MASALARIRVGHASPVTLCGRADPRLDALDPTDRARAQAMGARRQAGFVTARLLLRTLLATEAGAPPEAVRLARGPEGRVRAWVGDRAWAVSLSHTTGRVACAVAGPGDGGVGVDVEPVARRVDALRLARRFFAPSEVAALEALPEAARGPHFLALWTLKESLGKALGRGVSPVLRTPALAVGAGGQLLAGAGPGWSHRLCALASGHWLAVSARGEREIVVEATDLSP